MGLSDYAKEFHLVARSRESVGDDGEAWVT